MCILYTTRITYTQLMGYTIMLSFSKQVDPIAITLTIKKNLILNT